MYRYVYEAGTGWRIVAFGKIDRHRRIVNNHVAISETDKETRPLGLLEVDTIPKLERGNQETIINKKRN